MSVFQESCSIDVRCGAHEIEELLRRRIGCTPVTLFQTKKREPTDYREPLKEKLSLSAVSEPQRRLCASDQLSSAQMPKRFYRTFWRGIARRALAVHYFDCEMKPL
jgi:hypothetical protein